VLCGPNADGSQASARAASTHRAAAFRRDALRWAGATGRGGMQNSARAAWSPGHTHLTHSGAVCENSVAEAGWGPSDVVFIVYNKKYISVKVGWSEDSYMILYVIYINSAAGVRASRSNLFSGLFPSHPPPRLRSLTALSCCPREREVVCLRCTCSFC